MDPVTVTESTYDESLAHSVFMGLNEFVQNDVIDFVDRNVKLLHSMTYGEMTIATLLLIGLVLFVLKWVYEVIR